MNSIRFYLTAALFLTLMLFGCQKPEEQQGDQNQLPETPTISQFPAHGAIVLNEGGWGNNEAELSVIDYSDMTVSNSFFSKKNGRGLGDVAQDVVVYGNKVYVAVWGSNSVEAIDRITGRSTRIDMDNRGPRYIACEGGKVYVTCYTPASVVRIDTASLQIDATCLLSGAQPEGLCIVGGTIYVVNSWKKDSAGNPIYDSTLSVVDKNSFSETQKVTIGLNPQKVKVVDNSYIVVSYSGNYGDQPGGLAILNLGDMSINRISGNISNIDTYNGKIYYYAHNNGQAWDGRINIVDGQTLQESSITVSETSSYSAQYYPYAINVNPTSGEIYVAGAQYGANGDVYCFSQAGSLKWKAEVGPLPSKIVEL